KQQRLVDRVSNEVLAHESNLKQNLLRTHSRLRQESMPDTHLGLKPTTLEARMHKLGIVRK
ncbi:MAG: hypothetical protein WCE63_06620, partial [Acidobacteriaceae bacterium]